MSLTICPDCGASPADTRCECDHVGIRAVRKHAEEVGVLRMKMDDVRSQRDALRAEVEALRRDAAEHSCEWRVKAGNLEMERDEAHNKLDGQVRISTACLKLAEAEAGKAIQIGLEAEALRAQHARLRAALEPFARWAEVLNPSRWTNAMPLVAVPRADLDHLAGCTVADLRVAAKALKETA